MPSDIYEELLKYTDLTPLQSSLLVHISRLTGFGESVTHQRILIFTALRGDKLSGPDGRPSVLCITREHHNLSAVIRDVSPLWKKTLSHGTPYIDRGEGHFACIFPVVDNGGKVIGGIVFKQPNDISELEERMTYILAETMQRLMLTATDRQIQQFEPLTVTDGVIIFDHTGTIIYGNDTSLQLADVLGFDRRLVGTSVYGGALKISAVRHVIDEHMPSVREEIYHDMVIRQQLIPIAMGRNEWRCFLFLHDCTRESKQQQELLVKNSIIKEIHHRVKNNLQTVAGLLRMEARRSNLKEVKKALQEGISRIESMALVHDIVSHYDEDYISIRSVYDELCRLLSAALVQKGQRIMFTYDGDDCLVSSHRAGYISLIINELISNSMEHGFSGRDGAVNVHIKEGADTTVLTFTDDGTGLPKDFDIVRNKRLGLEIINNLVTHELSGTMRIVDANPGVRVTIEMKKER